MTDHGKPVTELNELEYIHGEIYANIWHADRIARISPATGRVVGWIDLKGLMPREQLSNDEAVLNGIAYDAAHNRLFVTGKLWPKIFEITLVPEKAKLVPSTTPNSAAFALQRRTKLRCLLAGEDHVIASSKCAARDSSIPPRS